MEKQQKKLSDKINKISSKITSEKINNKIKEINDKFNNKQIKYQAANKAINDQFKVFKLNNKINKIMKNNKLSKKQAVKKYINDEKLKIKKRQLEKIDKDFKNLDELNNKIDDKKEQDKINKKIKKYEDKLNKFNENKLNSQKFLITIIPYKLANKRNDENDLEHNNENYRLATRTNISYEIELPKKEYDNINEFVLDQVNYNQVNNFMKDLYLYKDSDTNQNIETYNKIIELLSDGSIILKILLDKISVDTHLVKNKKMIIDEEDVYGDIVNNRDVMIYNKFVDLKLNENNEFVSIYNNEYLNNNYNSLSCLFTIILEFKEYFEGKWNDGNKLFKTQPDMTYEGLLKYIYPNEEFIRGKALKSTLKDFEKFFYAFGIQVKVYDIYKQEIYKFDGIKNNKKLPNNGKLYLLYHNNHLQKINDVASFSHIINNIQNIYNNKINSLEKINFNYKTSSYDEFIIINNTDDLINNLNKYNNHEEDIKLSFVCFETLNNILFDLYYKHNLHPIIKNNGSIIKHIYYSYNNNNKKTINIIIKQYQHNGHIYDDNLEINKLNSIQKLQSSVSKKLLNYKYMSYYNDNTFNFIHYYRPKPIVKRYDTQINKNISYIDISKAYPSELLKINKVPIFTLFNYPKKYNNENINNYYIYLIEVLDDNDLIFYEKYTIIYGYNLKQIKINYNIIQFLEYTYLENIDTNEIIDEIFNIEDQILKPNGTDENLINEKNRKFIANNNIGLLGKFRHIKEQTEICNTEKQAQNNIVKYGGSYYKLNDTDNNKYLYFHVRKEYKKYKNGFLFFHMMIYDNMRTTLYNITNDMKNNKFNIYGIKTDAIYFESKNIKSEHINILFNKYGNVIDNYEPIIKDNINYVKYNIKENIGKLKYIKYTEEFDTIHIFDCLKGMINNKFEDYSYEIIKKQINIKDEYNINEIENKTIMTALVPGAGKSTACKKYLDKNNYKGLFVINNNNLAMEIKKEGYDAITPYQLLGINIYNENNETTKINKFNIEDYDVIIYEEVYFNEFKLLHKLYEFMLNNNDKIFLANGDPNQLECCQDVITINKKIDLVNTMFPNNIDLKIIKRCDSDVIYKIKNLIELNKDLDDDSELIKYIVNKFFKHKIIKDIGDIKTGISYTNETKTIMNNKIHKNIYGHNNFIVGQKITARDYCKFKDGNKLYRNYEYVIRNINNGIYTFEDEYTNILYELDEKLFNKYLDHSYIKTCHSSQGMTIKDKYIIYDWKYSYTSIKWLYVAISRCSNIDNIYFYDGEDNLNSIKNNISISSYKSQDKNRKYNDKDYIDMSWINLQLKKQRYICAICQDPLNGVSINRLDNNKAHIKNNCEITCILCNVRAK